MIQIYPKTKITSSEARTNVFAIDSHIINLSLEEAIKDTRFTITYFKTNTFNRNFASKK